MCVHVFLLKGELAISSEMEQLQSALFFENVPDTWTKLAYPSTYSLALWCVCVRVCVCVCLPVCVCVCVCVCVHKYTFKPIVISVQ